MPGPAPKPASKRRRYDKPKSFGAAEPATAPAAPVQERRELGFENLHPLVERMWAALQTSAESRFYSEADWERARWELWNASEIMRSGKPISGNTWSGVQHGLTELWCRRPPNEGQQSN